MGRKKLQRYYDQKLVGSYGGVAALRRVVPDQHVKRWLSEQDTYTLHKPVRRSFKRRCVVVGGPNQQWQADLVDVSRLKKTNDGTAFLLSVLPRPFSEGGTPCPFLVTPCPFQKAETTPCPFFVTPNDALLHFT